MREMTLADIAPIPEYRLCAVEDCYEAILKRGRHGTSDPECSLCHGTAVSECSACGGSASLRRMFCERHACGWHELVLPR